MRSNGTLNYILGDHLGSTSLVTDANGVVISETRYKAWGETRYSSGNTPTKYQFTGQYSYAGDFGLHFYNARWYDSSLSRFAQADSIVSAGVQGYDRYAYVNNAPVRYTDPSGHEPGACQDSVYVVQDPVTGSGSYVCNPTPLQTFGITINGGTPAQNQSILQSAQLSGNKLAATIGGGISPQEAFRRTHGKITINIGQGLGPESGNCETQWNGAGSTISCHSAPNLTNTLHEFGHAFDNYYHNTSDPGYFAGNYFGPTELPRNEYGYQCDESPCVEHSWVTFNNDPDFERAEDNFLEEFGDMYLNWVLDGNPDYSQNGFTTDLAGETRRQDMDNLMRYTWLPNMGLLP